MEQTKSAATQPDAMISVRNLRVSYGELEILHGISFDVMHGETLVILGGSGSGKSTLLRTLVGLERPSSGEIWLKGKNIAAISTGEMDEIRKKIGMSFQGGALFGSMTVGENVALPLREHTKLQAGAVERRHEEARRSGSRAGHGSRNSFLRRAFRGARSDYRRWSRSAYPRTQASLSHDYHRGHT